MQEHTRIDDVIDVASRLTALMELEIDSLRHMKVREIEAFQEDKDRLADTYLEHSRALAEDPEDLAALAPAAKRELKQALDRLHEVVGENERALRASREANNQLIQAVVDAIAERQGDASTYTRAGTIARFATSEAGQTPVSLNREL